MNSWSLKCGQEISRFNLQEPMPLSHGNDLYFIKIINVYISYSKSGSNLLKSAKQHGYITLPIDKGQMRSYALSSFIKYEMVSLKLEQRKSYSASICPAQRKHWFHTQTTQLPWMLWPLGRVKWVVHSPVSSGTSIVSSLLVQKCPSLDYSFDMLLKCMLKKNRYIAQVSDWGFSLYGRSRKGQRITFWLVLTLKITN